jgi:hypothetical protein
LAQHVVIIVTFDCERVIIVVIFLPQRKRDHHCDLSGTAKRDHHSDLSAPVNKPGVIVIFLQPRKRDHDCDLSESVIIVVIFLQLRECSPCTESLAL